jgi:ArsR family transcriptional regulator, arsenate/arsenite/antimonite-responsive transcriptional repressor
VDYYIFGHISESLYTNIKKGDVAMSKSTSEIEQSAIVLKLLGDKTRLTIISILKLRECCVCELLEVFETSQPSISQHLRKLKDAGLIKEDRRGQWIYYSLNQQSEFYGLIQDILEHVSVQTEKIKQIEKSNPTLRCGC